MLFDFDVLVLFVLLDLVWLLVVVLGMVYGVLLVVGCIFDFYYGC